MYLTVLFCDSTVTHYTCTTVLPGRARFCHVQRSPEQAGVERVREVVRVQASRGIVVVGGVVEQTGEGRMSMCAAAKLG